MKSLTCLIIALFLGINLIAQNGDHLTFKGIPITGKLKSFTSKLVSAGFKHETTRDDCTFLSGKFAGYEDCTIMVVSTPTTSIVWKVVVYLPDQYSWFSLKSTYNSMKKNYVEKYGAPSDTYELFLDPYNDGDGYELQAIKLEKGAYSSFWTFTQGSIAVSIKALSTSKGCVVLQYEDLIGGNLKSHEDTNEVQNDI